MTPFQFLNVDIPIKSKKKLIVFLANLWSMKMSLFKHSTHLIKYADIFSGGINGRAVKSYETLVIA